MKARQQNKRYKTGKGAFRGNNGYLRGKQLEFDWPLEQ